MAEDLTPVSGRSSSASSWGGFMYPIIREGKLPKCTRTEPHLEHYVSRGGQPMRHCLGVRCGDGQHPWFDAFDVYEGAEWRCVQCGAGWRFESWGDPVDCVRWLIAEARWWAERADSFAAAGDQRRSPYPMLPWLAAGYGPGLPQGGSEL